ncbi:hypothetical protein A1O1_04105 [Capronia coronata CBS 617.96]|uniref:Uncharacterized protein n=1 Tax=Capronia coronata CBS 617.96 TaxID=1182541 RepID=W9YEP0_9EURO|nr:uncharacterized protein A1O1_04105 [Capronia coronata CBS 617.96]EXJ90998.1 hypothetical protein A1O1_04105 [Capronia coronata CBS 617.96]
MTKLKQDLTASRWASPEVRREREFQSRAWTRTPSPHKNTINNSSSSIKDAEQPYSHSHHTPDPLFSMSTQPSIAAENGGQVAGTGLPPKSTAATTTTPLPSDIRHGGIPAPSSAPPTGTTPNVPLSTAQRQYLARQTELQRFRRLFRRLAWKANSLTHWSHRALSLAQEYQNKNHHDTINPLGHPPTTPLDTSSQQRNNLDAVGLGPRATLGRYEMIIDPIEAERQFKIDFFEFYALLERGLVCLLGVWGIVITSTIPNSSSTASHTLRNSTSTAPSRPSRIPDSASASASAPVTVSASTSSSIIGDSRTFHGMPHRFHANVLDALDHPSNPLHDILGSGGGGDVRAYIGVAKEFRNKWKDVEQRPDDSFLGHERAEEEWDRAKVRRYEKVLRDLRLDELLGTVLAGLEEAGRRAEAEVARLERMLGNTATVDARNSRRDVGAGGGAGGEDEDLDMLDAPFEVGVGVGMGERVDRDYDYEMEL